MLKITIFLKRIPKIFLLGKGSEEEKNVFFMVFYHTGGGGVSKGSEKTMLLF